MNDSSKLEDEQALPEVDVDAHEEKPEIPDPGASSSDEEDADADAGAGAASEGRARRGWSRDEDERLRSAIAEHGPHKWVLIASLVRTRKEKQCRERWYNHLSPSVKKGDWTQAEDMVIIACVNGLGTVRARTAHLCARVPVSCARLLAPASPPLTASAVSHSPRRLLVRPPPHLSRPL